MRNSAHPLTFAVNVLGMVEGRMAHGGQVYRFITNILSTPKLFRTYFNEFGTPTRKGKRAIDEATRKGKRAIDEATRKGRPFECQVFNDYCFLLRIKAEAAKIIEGKGGAA